MSLQDLPTETVNFIARRQEEGAGIGQFSQGDPALCWGSSAFLIGDVTFHSQWHIPVRQPPCIGKFACLGSHPSLATRKGATVVLASCHNCSFKLCLLFGPLGPRSLQQRQQCKNHNFGTATASGV